MVVKFKKNVALFLIGILLSLSICNAFHCDVLAASTSGTADAIGRYFSEIFYRLCNDYGYVFDDEKGKAAHDFIKKMSDGGDYLYQSYIDSYNNIVDGAISSGSLYYDSATGNIKISDATYKQLGNWLTGYLDEYFSQESNLPDVVWMPVLKSSDIPSTLFYSTTLYYQARSYVDSHKISALSFRGDGLYDLFCADASDYVVISCNWNTNYNTIQNWTNHFGDALGFSYVKGFFATKDGISKNLTGIPYDGYYHADGSGFVSTDDRYLARNNSYGERYLTVVYPFSNIPFSTYYFNYCYLFVSDDAGFSYVPVFKTLDAYKQWVTGQSDYYRVTPTYDGGDITINPNADYSKVYNNITTTIQNNYADGKDYSDILAAIQLAYAESMKEISAGLDDIGDNTEEANSWLEKIYNQVTDIDVVLKEQFDSMVSTITDGFNSVIDALHVITIPTEDDSGGDSGAEKKSFWTRLGEFCSSLINGILSLIETIFMKALDGLLYLADIVVDNVSLAFDGLTERFERLSALFGDESLFGNLRDAIPEEIQDILVMFMFGIVASGVVLAIKR